MTTTTSSEKVSSQGLLMLVAGIVAGAGVAYLLSIVAFPPEPAAVLASGAALLPPTVANARFKRRRGVEAELQALSHGSLVRPVPLVVAIVAGVSLLIFQVLAFGIGVAVGVGMAAAGEAVPMEDQLGLLGIAMLVTVYPAFLVVAFFIGRRACHYLSSRPYVWLLCSVVLLAILQLALDAIAFGPPGVEQLLTAIAYYAIVYGAMALGTWRGMRVHQQFVASRLLSKLPAADLRAVAELIGEAVTERSAATPPPPTAE